MSIPHRQSLRPPAASAKLRDQGLSMSKVGERLGVSKNVIVGICTRHLKLGRCPRIGAYCAGKT
jgi:hypothetical protein